MRIAWAGHRPPKFGGYDESLPAIRAVKAAIARTLQRAVQEHGTVECITGGALGVDQWVAEECQRQGVPYLVYAPCARPDRRWPRESRERYQRILEGASSVRHVGLHYTAACMQQRNHAMVDDADLLIAVYDGSPGGTANCVAYARRVRKPTVVVFPPEVA